jgi:arylformamidase
MSGDATVSLLLQHAGRRYAVDVAGGVSLAIPLDPHGAQPTHFGAPAAHAAPLAAGGFTGDTRLGGSCNCETITLVPHCNGTHTEGPGHVTRERLSVHDRATEALQLAALVTVTAEDAAACGETSDPAPQPGDRLITARGIEAALAALDLRADARCSALVVRTLPIGVDARARDWMAPPLPPYFSLEAMALLVARGVRHLLTDLPSVDRLLDEGRLAGHRVFFGLPPGSCAAAEVGRPESTITEMICVPATLADGLYALSLQLAPWVTDATPSRPLLYPLEAA